MNETTTDNRKGKRSKYLLILAATVAATGLMMVSCGTMNRTVMAGPSIPGATYVGSEACAACHEEVVRDFKTADHSRLEAKGDNAQVMGCEGCHGPGSKHVEAGGGKNKGFDDNIINPGKNPETCFQCHLEIKAKFSLPNRHPVMEGRISCSNCHNPHKGSAFKGGGTNEMTKNEVCFECHTAQRGPFVVQHEAVRQGCTTCHDPHGSVNIKMLTERNSSLCLKCHFQSSMGSDGKQGYIGGSNHLGRLNQGTCWSAGCHEAVHGSQMNAHLRF